MSQAASASLAAVLGTGTTISISSAITGSSSQTFQAIGEVKSLKQSGQKRGTTMATNFGSLGVAKKVGTILDYGTFTFTTNYVGTDPGQLAVNAACIAGGSWDFKIQLPIEPLLGQTTTGTSILVSGIITEAGSFDISLDAVSEYTFAVDVNNVAITAGA